MRSARDIQTQRYLRELRTAIIVDESTERANEEYRAGIPLGVTPVPPQYRSVAEQNADLIQQKQIAYGNFKSIMDPNEANTVMEHMVDSGLPQINANWSQIVTELKGRKNIDATFFTAFLQRFLNKYNDTLGTDYGTARRTRD
jgi:hypothetical protein